MTRLKEVDSAKRIRDEAQLEAQLTPHADTCQANDHLRYSGRHCTFAQTSAVISILSNNMKFSLVVVSTLTASAYALTGTCVPYKDFPAGPEGGTCVVLEKVFDCAFDFPCIKLGTVSSVYCVLLISFSNLLALHP